MLHEESWIPFEVTYDVTAWSNPLLMNLDGGWSGEGVEPAASVVPPGRASRPGTASAATPSVGLFEIPNSTRGFEAAFQTRYLFSEVWDLPFADVTADEIIAGRPATGTDRRPRHPRRLRELRPAGARLQGQASAPRLGQRRRPDRRLAGRRRGRGQGRRLDAPSSATRTRTRPGRSSGCRVDDASPLAAGIGDRRLGHVPGRHDDAARPRHGRRDVPRLRRRPTTRRPASRSASTRWPARPRSSTRRSAPDGSSRSRSTRTSGPGRRAPSGSCGTRSSGRIPPAFGHAAPAGSKARAAAEKAAVAAADRLPDLGSAIRIRVAGADATATAKILARHGAEVIRHRCRWGRAVPRRQPRRPVVRRASVLRARRPRPREGRDHATRGQPAVGVAPAGA